MGLIGEHSIQLCWVMHDGSQSYCSCGDFEYRLHTCKHLALLLKCFTKHQVVEIEE